MPHAPAVHVADLRFAYPSPLPGGSPIHALNGVDLDIAPGEFVAVMGPVGAGKSTLCFALNGAIPHAIEGEFHGQVVVNGQDTRDAPMGSLALQVGLVFEDAQAQLFNASVADEVAFGLEAMGLPVDEIERRIAEALHIVGLADLNRSPQTLSGGEQKRLALASVYAMRPPTLVLDEPTSGLDPRGRREVLGAIDRLRRERERGMTVVMTTQDAEAVLHFADRVVILKQGRTALEGSLADVFARVDQMDEWGIDVSQIARLSHLLQERTGRRFTFLRTEEAVRTLSGFCRTEKPDRAPRLPGSFPSPWTGVSQSGDDTLRSQAEVKRAPCAMPRAPEAPRKPDPTLVEIQDLSYRYPNADAFALSGVDLRVTRGEWLAVIGVNGSGKSTLIKHFNGLLKPSHGVVHVDGQDTRTLQVGELARTVGYLPQNPDRQIFAATVWEEVAYGPRQLGLREKPLDDRVAETLDLLSLAPYADHPPAVLGYGLRRQVALAAVLAMNASLLVLDEPAAGLDRKAIAQLIEIVAQRHRRGTTVGMITHDLGLASQCADRVVVLCQGRLVAQGSPQKVLTDIDALNRVGLEPLPVTRLAHALLLPAPLPLSAEELIDRLCPLPGVDDG